MKKTILCLIILLQFQSYAQDNPKWSLGLKYAVDNLSLSDGRDGIDYLITNGNINGYAIKFDKNNFSLGLTTAFSISKKIMLQSGILYTNKDFTGIYNCATCRLSQTIPKTIEQKFLTIPFDIQYAFLSGKWKPYLQAGVNSNMEIQNDLKAQSNGYFLELVMGASILCEIAANWRVGIGYNYQTTLSDLYKTDKFILKTNNVFIGIHYRLK